MNTGDSTKRFRWKRVRARLEKEHKLFTNWVHRRFADGLTYCLNPSAKKGQFELDPQPFCAGLHLEEAREVAAGAADKVVKTKLDFIEFYTFFEGMQIDSVRTLREHIEKDKARLGTFVANSCKTVQSAYDLGRKWVLASQELSELTPLMHIVRAYERAQRLDLLNGVDTERYVGAFTEWERDNKFETDSQREAQLSAVVWCRKKPSSVHSTNLCYVGEKDRVGGGLVTVAREFVFYHSGTLAICRTDKKKPNTRPRKNLLLYGTTGAPPTDPQSRKRRELQKRTRRPRRFCLSAS